MEATGTSENTMEEAIQNAIKDAGKHVKDIRWFEMIDTRGHVQDNKVSHFQVTVKIGYCG